MKDFFKDYWKVLEVSLWWLKKHWIGYIIFCLVYIGSVWLYLAIRYGDLQYRIRNIKIERKIKREIKEEET